MPGVYFTLASGGAGSGIPSMPPLPGRAIPLLPHQLFNDFHIHLQGLLPPHGHMAIPLLMLLHHPPTATNETPCLHPRQRNGPLEEVVARLLETVASDGGDRGPCAVCLDDLHGVDRRVGVLRCRHGFHGECIGKWPRKKNLCPLCRAIIV